MTISENAARARVDTLPHPAPVRASCERSVSDFGTSWTGPSGASPGQTSLTTVGTTSDATTSGNTSHDPRRMVAVTVALSEPRDSPELDWPETIAANLRLLYANTTVEVIDTWRNDE